MDSEKPSREIVEQNYLAHIEETKRKELGQVFTPFYIIRHMIHQTEPLSNLKRVPPSYSLKILDPACGLGRFLLECYEFLRERLQKSGWNGEKIHKTLLTEWLYGMDIEPLAVEFTIHALNLYQGSSAPSEFHICQGNFLEFPTAISDRSLIKEKFDVIIGNPPYFLISQGKKRARQEKRFHTTYVPYNLQRKYRIFYKAWPKKSQDPNVFYLFIERSIHLLRDGGYLSFIIPDIILSGDSTENLRKVILNTCCIKKIILIEGQVFKKRGISNVILILQKCKNSTKRQQNELEIIQTSTLELIENDSQRKYKKFITPPHYITQSTFSKLPQHNFATSLTKETIPFIEKIFQKLEMGTLIKLGTMVEIQRGVENLKKRDTITAENPPGPTFRKLIAASNIQRFQIHWDTSSFARRYIDFAPQNPKYSHINFKKRKWFLQPKLVLKRVSNELIAALDVGGNTRSDYYVTMDSVQMLWLKDQQQDIEQLKIILACLNSSFMNFYYKTLFAYKKLFARVQKAFLLELPIPTEIALDLKRTIINLTDQLIEHYIPRTAYQLDDLIFQLYFTPEESKQLMRLLHLKPHLRELPGIGLKRYWKLYKGGIQTLRDLIEEDWTVIANLIRGVGENQIKKWQKMAQTLLEMRDLS
ncbi:MAG: N-6 DNA methylase [Candidatus Helarchaeota archaeon]